MNSCNYCDYKEDRVSCEKAPCFIHQLSYVKTLKEELRKYTMKSSVPATHKFQLFGKSYLVQGSYRDMGSPDDDEASLDSVIQLGNKKELISELTVVQLQEFEAEFINQCRIEALAEAADLIK